MTDDVTARQLREALAEVDLPAARGRIEEALAERDLVEDPVAVTGDAIEAGTLVEAGEGTFGPLYRVEDPDPDVSTPTPDGDETTEQDVESGAGEEFNQHPRGEDRPVLVNGDSWFDLDFSTTRSDSYPPALNERGQWMGRKAGEKLPFAPWGDKNHPEADADTDARYKWGIEDHYVDGETVAIAEDDPRLDGRVFIQREIDPFAFVDGDDVRDPETDEVHPAFIAILQHLGLTYADVSTSGSGVHAYYLAPDGLPIDGKGQATFDLDTEPWGSNDAVPTVEIYTNKHVCVTTGEHIEGTPLEVREWDETALRAILQANGYEDEDRVSHDTDRDRPDLKEHDPKATGADDTADDVRDVLLAVDRLTPRDLPLRTTKTGEDSTGWDTYDPSYRASESGESLHYNHEGVFHDHKEGEAFGVLSLFAAEQGIISDPWDRLAGRDWWDAVDAAREAGARIPQYAPPTSDGVEQTAVLPTAVRDLTTAASGWDWKHAGRTDDTLTVEDARERTVDAIADAYERGDRVLVEALPTMGKSYGAVKAAADTDQQVTVLTGRGHKEQYDQFREWCDEHGLDYYTLPSFTRDCDTANGEHGEEWADTVREWYRRGATPKEIHAQAEYVLDRPLPCQEHEGQRCPYASKWDFDPEEYDVLIGHYSHAHKSKVTAGRTVVFDEFPDAYETLLGPELQGAVSYWLQTTDGVPFDSYTDLLENRDDESRRADALLWFDEHGVEPDETHVFDDAKAHADAPLAVFTILAGDDLGNGFERADLDDVGLGVFDRATGAVFVLRPPALEYASGIVALDGTPTKRMWELALGERLNHRPVLQGEERAEYLQDALNLNLVRTTDAVKPYNSSEHVNTEQDAALLEAIAEKHGERPSVITTTTAEHEYDADGVLEHVDDTKHYGNVLGSNEFDDTRLGAVIGSNHYGDGYIKKWGAYAGEAVDRGDEKGADLSYSGFGDDVLQHMREHDTLQAAMRFGRDGNGAVVYVHTDTLPEWVPLAGEGRVLTTWSDGMRDVVEALEDLTTATTADVVEHPAVDLSRQQVFEHLERLRERGVLQRQQDPEDGRRVVWRDDGIHRLGEHGEVELEPVDLEDLDDDEVRQLARSSIYTWEFTNPRAEDGGSTGDPSLTTPDPVRAPANGGDGPPDDAD